MGERYSRRFIVLVSVCAVVAAAGRADAAIMLGGTAHQNIATALNQLGKPFTDVGSGFPAPGSADTIILGMDGGLNTPADYHSWLDSGGHLIVAGGSNVEVWRTWAAQYFNITDTAATWHTDGAWHKVGLHPASDGLPTDYTFVDNNVSFHMLAFLATPNTTLYARNDEPNFIGAFRTYNNGGNFNYLSIDPGPYGTAADLTNFTKPWVNAALNASVPEPAGAAFIVACGLIGTLTARKRRRA
jgi:hypothetical protein